MAETEAIFAFIISLANVFGLFPVCRKKIAGRQQICFKWRSFQVIHCLIISVGFSVFNIIFDVVLVTKEGVNFARLSTVILHCSTLVEIYVFFLLAMQWPNIMKQWTRIDCTMRAYLFPGKLKLELKLFTAAFCIAALCEHFLFILYITATTNRSEFSGFTEFIRISVQVTSESILYTFGYNTFLGILHRFYLFHVTFCWNFTDLFLMVVSIVLSIKFHQLAERLKRLLRFKIKYEFIWMEIRNHYDSLCKLCDALDAAISLMILVSFLNSIYTVVIQLNSIIRLEENAQLIKPIYFIYSLMFILFRALGVSHFAGRVYSSGKTVREYLNYLPHDVYNSEIDRFLTQVQSTQPALSGRQFFRVDDTLIFSVIRAMLSYEIILMQF